MPPVSQMQRRAMFAAAEGKSNLGIPTSVGKDFVAAGKGVTGLPNRVGKKDPPKAKGHRFAKAMTHHQKIGQALADGDHATAMKHTGHMMLAIRAAKDEAEPIGQAPNDNETAETPAATQTPGSPVGSLMSRLKGLRGR